MATRPTKSEADVLELYRISLTNVVNQPEIAQIMAEFGYGQERIAVGKDLLEQTREVWVTNKEEDEEASLAYQAFSRAREDVAKVYNLHRKKAKVIFRDDSDNKERLGIDKSFSRAYAGWLEEIKKFYKAILGSQDIQNALAPLKVSAEQLAEAQTLVQTMEDARAVYLKEKGESQTATQRKDRAFSELDKWMRDFYDIAKISMEDEPQLLESLGKLVKA